PSCETKSICTPPTVADVGGGVGGGGVTVSASVSLLEPPSVGSVGSVPPSVRSEPLSFELPLSCSSVPASSSGRFGSRVSTSTSLLVGGVDGGGDKSPAGGVLCGPSSTTSDPDAMNVVERRRRIVVK